MWPTFATDGVPNYSHYSPIRKLSFITKIGSSSAQIGVLDELLSVSTWSLVETDSRGGGIDFDLSVRIGGRFKLIENFNENLMYIPELAQHHSLLSLKDSSVSLELEFDTTDPNIIFFSTPGGLYKFNRKESIDSMMRMDTSGLGSPSSLSMSDRGYLLVGFTCGSIG